MTFLICRNRVVDFDQWKRVFDSHGDAHAASGLELHHVWRNLDDGNEVFMVFKVLDLDKARGFVTAADVPEAQCQASVTEASVYFVE